jgi:hypothetical protein
MMVDAKASAWTQRLLRGEFRLDDLANLFLYARDRCSGNRAVKDIGDFHAHHNERDRGIITDSTRDWFAVVRYFSWRSYPPGGPNLDYTRMPPATRDYFKIAANRVEPRFIRQHTGLNRAAAQKMMLDLVERLTPNPDGTWALPIKLAVKEGVLVNCVSSQMVVKPAFSGDDLCDGLLSTLKREGLLSRSELRAGTKTLRSTILLFAVAAMHNCVVQIGDGTTTQLKAQPDIVRKTINVNAPVPTRFKNWFSSAMFTADLDPSVHCHPDLLEHNPLYMQVPSWDFEVEVAPDKLLHRL